MINVKWIGLITDDYEFTYEPIPENAKLINEDNIMSKGFAAGVVGVIIGFIVLFLKKYLKNGGELPIMREYIVIGCIIGIIMIVIHEWLHLVCYPRSGKGFMGIEGIFPFSFCASPVSRNRFIVSSLLPIILGIVPLSFFYFFPTDWMIIDTIMWCVGTVSLATPGNDYVEVFLVLKQVPRQAVIQSGSEGFYWYMMEDINE